MGFGELKHNDYFVLFPMGWVFPMCLLYSPMGMHITKPQLWSLSAMMMISRVLQNTAPVCGVGVWQQTHQLLEQLIRHPNQHTDPPIYRGGIGPPLPPSSGELHI